MRQISIAIVGVGVYVACHVSPQIKDHTVTYCLVDMRTAAAQVLRRVLFPQGLRSLLDSSIHRPRDRRLLHRSRLLQGHVRQPDHLQFKFFFSSASQSVTGHYRKPGSSDETCPEKKMVASRKARTWGVPLAVVRGV